MRRLVWLFLAATLFPGDASCAAEPPDAIQWQPWSDSVFLQAKREHKFVLLDLEAGWCHWCHVMDHETYSDPGVIALIKSRYIAVRVDQDSRPDLANRYENYGWPATVVFTAGGGEIVKRQGFFPPRQMRSMLQAIIDDPSPGPSVTGSEISGPAAPSGVDALRRQLVANYDFALGGWSTSHRFLDWDNVEWALVEGRRGDAQAAAIAKQMLTQQMKLIDPVWGGVDQYSIQDWDHPHFEKLIQMQAENLRIYSLASLWLKDPAYLQAAREMAGYVRAFLTGPDSVVYTSQDADVVPGQPAESYYQLDEAGRRKIGVPRVDKHIYARENGWYISARLAFYAATHDPRERDAAAAAAQWIVQNRALPGGGFRHGAEADPRLYLGDTLAMGRAFLALYAATGDPGHLARAEKAADFIRAHFGYGVKGSPTGFATAVAPASPLFPPMPEFDENVALARFANLLFHYSARSEDEQMAKTALRFCEMHSAAGSRGGYVGGLLLAERELQSEPTHVVVIGPRNDPAAQQLFLAAVFHPVDYEQIQWFDAHDPSAGSYPALPHPAAFLCTNQSCSSPLGDEKHLVAAIETRTSGPRASSPN